MTAPNGGRLTVAIYNVLGEEVARLADNFFVSAGETELTWNAVGLPNGVYFARARFGDHIKTVQMVLVK